MGTFHDREGETAFASGDGAFKAGWARLFGGTYKQSWSGDVSPAFNGGMIGVQVGLPLLGLEHSGGERDRAGLFFGYASASGSVTGFALGQQGMPVGNIAISAYSVGAYWTHFWPAGGYVDAVLMVSWLTGSTLSSLNVATNAYGRMGTASLELGYPIPFPGPGRSSRRPRASCSAGRAMPRRTRSPTSPTSKTTSSPPASGYASPTPSSPTR